MGAQDGAEIAELTGIFLLKQVDNFLSSLGEKAHAGLYRDDGLIYSRVAYIYVRSRAKYLKLRTTTSKFNSLRKPLMQQKYYFIHEM